MPTYEVSAVVTGGGYKGTRASGKVWALDERDAEQQQQADFYPGMDLKITVKLVPTTHFLLHDAWIVGEWVVSPYAIIHSDFATIASDNEDRFIGDGNGLSELLRYLSEVAASAPAEPLAICRDSNDYYGVDLGGFPSNLLSVAHWLPAWEIGGLNWGTVRGEDFPRLSPGTEACLLSDANGRVVGAAMCLHYDDARLPYVDVLWRDGGGR